MTERYFLLVSLLMSLMLTIVPVFAQDGDDTDTSALEPEVVKIEAEDGLMLVGDYYFPTGEMDRETVPAVILLHMLSSNRTKWESLIPVLVNDYGLAVLNIDMRGHGATGGSQDWPAAETDVQTLIDWLRTQDGINPDAVSIVGASIGSNLALRGWANDETVLTAVALSPGLDYRGVTTQDAVEAGSDRAVMLVASRQDTSSALAVTTLFAATTADVQVRLYSGRLHGTQLLENEAVVDELTHSIGIWIIAQLP